MQIKSLILATFAIFVGATAVAASLEPASSAQAAAFRKHQHSRYSADLAARDDFVDPGPDDADPAPQVPEAATDPNKDLTDIASKLDQQVTAPLLEIAAAADLKTIDLSTLLQSTKTGLTQSTAILGNLIENLMSAPTSPVPHQRRADVDVTAAAAAVLNGASKSLVSGAARKMFGAAKDAAQHLVELKLDLSAGGEVGELVDTVFELFVQFLQTLAEVVPSIRDLESGPLESLQSTVGELF
ncbi:unnamed protein product [Tilletia controversa]|uniref:Uncharacterized protein n=3 Tax=Tilletia TaxID=13289 RepID=A0A8X7MUJ0_9BASI|nr:hypothetical protein CF336_g34 [Tilletia laevis]KAE8203448.1 hypothetical protein CF328_g1651 [Tilletia controversa]KAE8264684.1 hypothetical protein A4X03_0g775 [Tilletia caries]KAE8205969.1 hypothetical protein CF335_g2127 [Tilletia laevis]KAE8249567.1 hypothetical protein A4X06_0g3168 [Tilletia controversa]